VAVLFGTVWYAIAQGEKNPYPSMAPLDQYLMDRDAEIALARSAAPDSISRDATVMVLGRHFTRSPCKARAVSYASWNVPDFSNR
jgi:hypothetical protein